MAGVEAIAPGTTAADYSFTNDAAAPISLYLTPASGKELVDGMVIKVLKIKENSTNGWEVGRLTLQNPSYLCVGGGKFKLVRDPQAVACGADVVTV